MSETKHLKGEVQGRSSGLAPLRWRSSTEGFWIHQVEVEVDPAPTSQETSPGPTQLPARQRRNLQLSCAGFGALSFWHLGYSMHPSSGLRGSSPG